MSVLAAIVNTTTLGKTIAYSLAAGIGIAVIFGAGVSSAAGLVDARRDGRTLAGLAWGALAVVCLPDHDRAGGGAHARPRTTG